MIWVIPGKEHLATDADNELTTAVTVTLGNGADSDKFVELVYPHAREVTADKGYDSNADRPHLQTAGRRRPQAAGQRSGLILQQSA